LEPLFWTAYLKPISCGVISVFYLDGVLFLRASTLDGSEKFSGQAWRLRNVRYWHKADIA
ncbi:MAG: hypothetical protein WA767_11775, partial [Pseudolabrys sp.]